MQKIGMEGSAIGTGWTRAIRGAQKQSSPNSRPAALSGTTLMNQEARTSTRLRRSDLERQDRPTEDGGRSRDGTREYLMDLARTFDAVREGTRRGAADFGSRTSTRSSARSADFAVTWLVDFSRPHGERSRRAWIPRSGRTRRRKEGQREVIDRVASDSCADVDGQWKDHL